jgi:formyltetrahydrofolate deformylase
MENSKGLKTGRVLLSAKDRPGIHEAIFSVIRKSDYSVTDPSGKSIDGYYLLRNEFSATGAEQGIGEFRYQFSKSLEPLNLEGLHLWVVDAERRKKTAILVSKITYCLEELLHHWKEGDLNFDIACVISNDRKAEQVAKANRIEFQYVDAGDKRRDRPGAFEDKKLAAERRIHELTSDKVDFYILAKWHRILLKNGPLLSNGHQIMSVHPSLLPSFIGGRAIADAYEGGVKIAGATAHLVTKEDKNIDEGPKLLQITQNVGNLSWQEFEKGVQFAEREAIYRAAKIVCEDRYLVYPDPQSGTRKTFIF